jgi:hypothetical protein
VFLCECRSLAYSGYYNSSALERARLGPSMGGDQREIEHVLRLGSLWVAQVLRLSIDAVVGFRASISNCDVDH